MQFDSRHLSALSAILRLGSFEAAAGALNITQSAVSQRLKALEEQVGTVLVLRESPCVGTDAGRRLSAHAEAVALLEDQASRDLGQDGTSTAKGHARLRVAVNADSLATWFLGALDGLDDTLFDLVIDDESHSAEWLKKGEVLAAVTQSSRPVQGCDVIPLGSLRYIATASPKFMKTYFPDGVTPKALKSAPMLQFNEKDGLQSEWLSTQFGRGITPPSHGMPSSQAFVEAARRGIGWGMNPAPLVSRLVRRGILVPLVEENASFDKPLYWQVSRMMRPVLEPLTKAVKARASEVLVGQPVADEGAVEDEMRQAG
ncbi:LysR family transcriptional regulator ArgP [Rhodobacteraceae bacterium D3-12]|nr:LysR family transcriptional regulator ArgP [Rhodobacteraceae bacterium D3-12]